MRFKQKIINACFFTRTFRSKLFVRIEEAILKIATLISEIAHLKFHFLNKMVKDMQPENTNFKCFMKTCLL